MKIVKKLFIVLVLLFSIFSFSSKNVFAATDSKIVFFDNTNTIYTINPDGTDLTTIGAGTFPQVSPDGEKIVYMNSTPEASNLSCKRGIEDDIYTMNIDGSNIQDLTYGSTCVSETPKWSPNGNQIIYGTSNGQTQEINIMNVDGTNKSVIITNGFSPTISPDGTTIAYMEGTPNTSGYGIYTAKIDGSNQTLIYQPDVAINGPAWSPDGTKIAFTALEENDTDTDIDTINPDGSDFQAIYAIPPSTGSIGSAVSWSPDGTELAFSFDDSNLDDISSGNVIYANKGIDIFDIATDTLEQIYANPTVAESYSVNTVDWYSVAPQTYTVSGNVFIDSNKNGTLDPGEQGVAGETVTLNTGQSTTTDSNGNYTFSNLESGTYTETLTVPSGYTATTTNPVSVPLSANTTENFGIAQESSLVTAINAGGDTQGSFVADTDYSGGTTYSTTSSIDTSNVTNPAPQAVYQTVRYGNFTYTVPNLTPNTNYTLRLHIR